jgi:hypothetical protein
MKEPNHCQSCHQEIKPVIVPVSLEPEKSPAQIAHLEWFFRTNRLQKLCPDWDANW